MDWQLLVYGLQLQSGPVCSLFAVHRTGLSNTTYTGAQTTTSVVQTPCLVFVHLGRGVHVVGGECGRSMGASWIVNKHNCA
jgi:hypothetical protein